MSLDASVRKSTAERAVDVEPLSAFSISGKESTAHLRLAYNRHPDNSLDPAGGLNQYYSMITAAREMAHLDREINLATVKELQALLLHGTSQANGTRLFPFTFRAGSTARTAHGVGLEGFIHAENDLVRNCGREASIRNLSNYHIFVRHLLEPVHWTQTTRKGLQDIMASNASEEQKYGEFMRVVSEFTANLKEKLIQQDCSRWIRESRVYQIFPRAFNLPNWREAMGLPIGPSTGKFFADFTDRDLHKLTESGFNSIYVMGIYPTGRLHAKGDGGGSPFSVRRYCSVDPAYGSDRDVKNFVLKCNQLGVSVLVDLVLNHSAVDADLVVQMPEAYIHREDRPESTRGYYFCQESNLWLRNGGYLDDRLGRKEFWTDTLQFNLWNPALRRIHIATTRDLLDRYDFNGFRVDMAYQMLNEYFGKNWNDEIDLHLYPRPSREFIEELITEIKSTNPGTAFLAEGYGAWPQLSEAGFDTICGFNDMECNGSPHFGWYQALASKNPNRIRHAVKRTEFLHCNQTGGADMFVFPGDHDRPAPWRRVKVNENEWIGFGKKWVYGATHLTLLKPGPLLFYGGQEAQFDLQCDEDNKSITFNHPVTISWEGINSDFGKFVQRTFQTHRQIEKFFGTSKLHFTTIKPPVAGDEWVGYVIHRASDLPPYAEWIAIIANPLEKAIIAECNRPDLGVGFQVDMEPCGPQGFETIIWPAARD